MKNIKNFEFRNIAIIYFDVCSFTTKIITIKGVMVTLPYSLEVSLELLCIKAGSTLNGRMVAFREIVGITQKPAILLSESDRTLLMPTKALNNKDCFLINYSNLINIKQVEYFRTNLKFYNNFQYTIPADRRTLKRQCLRCYEFLHLLDDEDVTDGDSNFLINKFK